jgi:hypothetical protein
MLYSYCTHTVLILYSCCTHTVLILYSYTILTPYSYTILILYSYTILILYPYSTHKVGMQMMQIVLHKHAEGVKGGSRRRQTKKKAPPVCFDFVKKGECWRGDACVFHHEKPAEEK